MKKQAMSGMCLPLTYASCGLLLLVVQVSASSVVLSAASEVRFLADEYRVVMSLDVSPSVSTVDPVSHSIMFEEVARTHPHARARARIHTHTRT